MQSPSRRGRRALTAVAAAAVLVAAGCGSSTPRAKQASAPTTTKAAPTTKPTTSTTVNPGQCTNASVVAGWPVKQRAAQVLAAPVLNFDTQTVSTATAAGVGGLLLLGSGTPPSDLARSVQSASQEPKGSPAPMVMADEEGGEVQRLEGPVSTVPWARQMAASLSATQVQGLATTVGQQMHQLGVDVDLAPVLDVDGGDGPNDQDPDGQRSFSTNPTTAATYGIAWMKGLEAGGVVPVVKHFPGLGGATGNTDEGPASTPALSTLQDVGLRPFEAAIGAGAPAVMVANATVPGLTSTPASLSPSVIQGLLEQKLGFSGLVLTDSLSAGAISAVQPSLDAAVVESVAAGADLILFGSTLDSAQTGLLTPANVGTSVGEIVDALAAAVTAGQLPAQRLDDAATAVVNAKRVDLCSGG